MGNYRTIEIDLAIHKAIERERISLDEPDLAILHRMLTLASNEEYENEEIHTPASNGGLTLRHGVLLPDGTEMRMVYKGKTNSGFVRDGTIQVNGKTFQSPSSAAMAITQGFVNGWMKWEVRKPGSNEWVLLNSLR